MSQYDFSPFTRDEIWETFHSPGSFTKHLLTIYSIAIGVNARRILDIGIGTTTKALRLAAQTTGGSVFSCDADAKRFQYALEQQTDTWKLSLESSDTFLKTINEPVDFVMHDGSHSYEQVKIDLELIFPLVKKFGVICVHDTQQAECGLELMDAVRTAETDRKFSATTLPYNCGLTIIRMEDGTESIDPAGRNTPSGEFDTVLTSVPTYFTEGGRPVQRLSKSSLYSWVSWKLHRLFYGYY